MNTGNAIKTRMAEILRVPVENLQDDVPLMTLTNSSFLLVEMIIELQEEFGVRFGQADMQHVTSVGDFIGLFECPDSARLG